jgi:phosphoribosylanthranilate isomerase
MFIKICGITNEQDALLAVALGADALGFVFAPSPRQIAPGLARDIVKRLPPEIMTVGVFRNEHPSRVIEIVNEARLQGAQLHGHESIAITAEVAAQVRFVIKAVVAGSADASNADLFSSDAVLVDGLNPGSGATYDWNLLSQLPDSVHVILSGGLTAGKRYRASSAVGSRCEQWGREKPRSQGRGETSSFHHQCARCCSRLGRFTRFATTFRAC